jgi:methionyl-tRNA formyltransferase
MKMDIGMDTGPMLKHKAVPITSTSTTQNLMEDLSVLGAQLLLDCIDPYVTGTLMPTPQPTNGVIMAPKIDKSEMELNWADDAATMERKMRALGSVWLPYGEDRIKILSATVTTESHTYPVGQVIDDQLSISCKAGILHPIMVQRAGGKAQSIADFLHGHPIPAGTSLKS